jgi:hypothetical protein
MGAGHGLVPGRLPSSSPENELAMGQAEPAATAEVQPCSDAGVRKMRLGFFLRGARPGGFDLPRRALGHPSWWTARSSRGVMGQIWPRRGWAASTTHPLDVGPKAQGASE